MGYKEGWNGKLGAYQNMTETELVELAFAACRAWEQLRSEMEMTLLALPKEDRRERERLLTQVIRMLMEQENR